MSGSESKLNGSPRKTLSSQLDRLESIIDTLADGLNDALALAVRDAVAVAVKEAVQAVTRELLSNPEILRAVAGTAHAPVATVATERPVKHKPLMRPVWDGLVAALGCLMAWGVAAMPVAKKWGNAIWLLALRHPAAAAASLAVGVTLGIVGYLCGPMLSSLTLALCGAAVGGWAFFASPLSRLWADVTRED